MSKLDQLTRQLKGPSANVPVVKNEVFTEVINAAIADKAQAAINDAHDKVKLAQAEQRKAEDRADAMHKKMEDLHREMSKMQTSYEAKLDAARKDATQAIGEISARNTTTVQRLRSELEAVKDKLAEECAARAAAEATVKTMSKSHESMERMMNKPAPAPAPVVVPPPAPRQAPVPLTVAVSQRDQNGRIVSMTIKPTP